LITLDVKEKGHMIEIPGIAPFRTPARIDISRVKLNLIISSLNNSGVSDYEIIAREDKKETVYTKEDFELPKKTKEASPDLDNINERFNKIEGILKNLLKKSTSKKSSSEEQITNKLNALEELSRRILEKESVQEIVYTSSKEKSVSPVIEDLDDDLYIPKIYIDDMELKGTASEKIGEVEDPEEAADMLSRLKK
jgi:hypothetical protein